MTNEERRELLNTIREAIRMHEFNMDVFNELRKCTMPLGTEQIQNSKVDEDAFWDRVAHEAKKLDQWGILKDDK